MAGIVSCNSSLLTHHRAMFVCVVTWSWPGEREGKKEKKQHQQQNLLHLYSKADYITSLCVLIHLVCFVDLSLKVCRQMSSVWVCAPPHNPPPRETEASSVGFLAWRKGEKKSEKSGGRLGRQPTDCPIATGGLRDEAGCMTILLQRELITRLLPVTSLGEVASSGGEWPKDRKSEGTASGAELLCTDSTTGINHRRKS